jgi:RND family efflux transporter MFP subunit
MGPEKNVYSDATKIDTMRGILVKLVIPIGILIIALVFAKFITNTSHEIQRQKPQQQAKIVEVIAAEHTDIQTVVHAMGTVVPAQEVILTPQVSGQIVSLSPALVPGGLVKAGDSLLEIDPRDYKFSIKQCNKTVAQARLHLKLEQGNQVVAQTEYNLLGELVSEQDSVLILREPHLKEAEAALEASEAALAQAELNRDRCRITAPFNGIIREKMVDQGTAVSPSVALLSLVGTNEYWIETTVRVDDLNLIQIPGNDFSDGSPVQVFNESQWGFDVYRQGNVIRLLPDLETAGRMARLLIRIQDPLSLDSGGLPILLIGSYVRVKITGKTIPSVIPVARDYLHDGNTVWIMNKENCLEIRPVEVVFKDKFTVYVSYGIDPGEHIIVTDIITPVENMLLRLDSSSSDDENHQENQL